MWALKSSVSNSAAGVLVSALGSLLVAVISCHHTYQQLSLFQHQIYLGFTRLDDLGSFFHCPRRQWWYNMAMLVLPNGAKGAALGVDI